VEGIRPDNPVLDLRSPGFDFSIPGSVAGMDAEITRQASMVAYLDGYWILFVLILLIMPFLFLLRPAHGRADEVRLEIHPD
jgi:DHA2 family multidrug resistance protein